MVEKIAIFSEIGSRLPYEGVVTHFGDDLDNRFALEALRMYYGLSEIKVDRTAAGKPVSGRINIDVGDELCTEPVVKREDGTIVIDHHYSGKRNTLEILMENGIYVPKQAVELADTPVERQVDPLDYRSGLALARYASNEQLWRLAEEEKLAVTLNEQQLKEYGLQEAAIKQKAVVDNAVQKVEKGAVGAKAVVVEEFVPGGSQVAYRLGYGIYISVNEHKNGATFAVTARPGTMLPQELLDLGERYKEKYGNDVFIRPDKTLIVVGGPKNPEFAVPSSAHVIAGELKSVIKNAN